MNSNTSRFSVALLILSLCFVKQSTADNLSLENLSRKSDLQRIFELELGSNDQYFILNSLTEKGFSCKGYKKLLNVRGSIHCIYHGCNRRSFLEKRYTIQFRSEINKYDNKKVSAEHSQNTISPILFNVVNYVPELSLRCKYPTGEVKLGDTMKMLE